MASKNNSSGKRKLTIGILVILLATCFALLIAFYSGIQQRKEDAFIQRVKCGSNLSGLAKLLTVYARINNGSLPPAEQWCNLLIAEDYTSLRMFICRASDVIEGESSYAINKNVAGKEISGFDPNVVLLFETDAGEDSNGREELLRNRTWYDSYARANEFFHNRYSGSEKVYRSRWNQAGGPEILTTKYHDGKGCWVVFVGIHIEFVELADLPNLKWK